MQIGAVIRILEKILDFSQLQTLTYEIRYLIWSKNHALCWRTSFRWATLNKVSGYYYPTLKFTKKCLSEIFKLYCLTPTKKLDHFMRNFVKDPIIFSRDNESAIFTSNTVLSSFVKIVMRCLINLNWLNLIASSP